MLARKEPQEDDSRVRQQYNKADEWAIKEVLSHDAVQQQLSLSLVILLVEFFEKCVIVAQ